MQAVPYAQDEFVLLVPSGHELAQRGSIDKCELYNLSFVSLNKGSSVQAAQEETLLQQGIKWHKLHTYMVSPATYLRSYAKHACMQVFIALLHLTMCGISCHTDRLQLLQQLPTHLYLL